jgi:hypothetical protein
MNSPETCVCVSMIQPNRGSDSGLSRRVSPVSAMFRAPTFVEQMIATKFDVFCNC